MRHTRECIRRLLLAVIACAALPPLVRAQARTDVVISDAGAQAESVTSSQDGTVYFGSTATGTIYRAAPGASRAEPWIPAAAAGLSNVLGVLADDKSGTLWVCQNNTGGRGGAPVVGQTALRSFDLKSAAAKGTYPFPTNGGVCNDMAIASDGTVYATESFGNRIHRLRPGATALDVWATDPQLAAVDGITLLADGAVYVNTFLSGKLFRIPVNADGSAGAIVPIETSLPLSRPDGLRTVGPRTMIQAEGQGRVAELTINGNRADVRVLQDGLTGPTGVTVTGNTAFVLVERSRAVLVPYQSRDNGVLATCEELGIGFVPFSPLGAGFLTGTIDAATEIASTDFRAISPRFAADARAANAGLVALLTRVAERKSATPAQIALAWLLAQKPWIVPIPGTRKLTRLEENLGAVSVELDTQDLHEIDTAASAMQVHGARLPEAVLKLTHQ